MILRCTKKLLTVIRPRQLIDCTPDGEDWYANLLWLGARKCLLLTHATTLFTVLEADVRAADLLIPLVLLTHPIVGQVARLVKPVCPAGRGRWLR